MSALLLSGREVASKFRADLAVQIKQFQQTTGITPGLAVILVGDDAASQVYVRTKIKAGDEVGINGQLHHFAAHATQAEVEERLAQLNADENVHGIIVQWPVPPQIDYDVLIDGLLPDKDVDGFHPTSVGMMAAGRRAHLPATPAGIFRLLQAYNLEVAGRHAVVVGRSRIVGRPLALMLMQRDATVTICHSRTRDLAGHTRQADLLVVAAGRAGLVTADMVKPDAVVVDVGVNRTADGTLAGDIDFHAVAAVAKAVTPVPGGVGPMTVAELLHNTFEAAQWLHSGT